MIYKLNVLEEFVNKKVENVSSYSDSHSKIIERLDGLELIC